MPFSCSQSIKTISNRKLLFVHTNYLFLYKYNFKWKQILFALLIIKRKKLKKHNLYYILNKLNIKKLELQFKFSFNCNLKYKWEMKGMI